VAAPTFADRVVYSVDGATALPQPVTVATKGDGTVVVLYSVPEIQDGMTLSFTLTLKTRGNGSGIYPATGYLKVKGKKVYALAAEPSSLTFDGPDLTVTSTVILTVHKPGHGKVKKLQAKVKLAMEGGCEVGNGPGVKVIVVENPGEWSDGPGADIDLRSLLDEFAATPHPPIRKEE
jgi:hypothetical protein